MPLALSPFIFVGMVAIICIIFSLYYIPAVLLYFLGLGCVYLVTGSWPTLSLVSLYQIFPANSLVSNLVDYVDSFISHAVGLHQLLADAASWNIIYGIPVFFSVFFVIPAALVLCIGLCSAWWTDSRNQAET